MSEKMEQLAKVMGNRKPLETKKQVFKQTNKQVKKQVSKLPNSSVPLRRYATYLPDDLIKKIKMKAINSDKKDYQIVNDALRKHID